MAKRLFGTDGIRGEANKFPMTPDVVLKVGQALGVLLKKMPGRQANRRTVLIGKDTRLSGYMLEQALASGLNSMGVNVQLTGPLPTPGIGFLARNMRVDAGLLISASHNPYNDNGIKIFGADGFKIPDAQEREIERLVEEGGMQLASGDTIGRTRRIDDAAGRYIVYVKNAFPLNSSLEGMRIVLDCANGAAYKVAPAIFSELGADVVVIGDEPDGYNINDKAGALHPERVCEAVLKYRADVGISLDGDGDRVIMVDDRGEIVNGDHILAVCAIHLAKNQMLPQNTIVATQMSNVGLDHAMKKHGIYVVRTDVGDKNVVEAMRQNGYSLGGEQSGHIIHMSHSTTGDGCVAALRVLAVMRSENRSLSQLKSTMEDVPQVLINTRVGARKELSSLNGYTKLIENAEAQLKGEGRIFVRFSGTEPVIRVLVEGRDKSQISRLAEQISKFLQTELS
ncbi:MAG: phosphoglucosamine mutase [Bdellovibrionales bacterium]|nr:phosphoglucosamine mutase [Bdellovibrionales bacterium]